MLVEWTGVDGGVEDSSEDMDSRASRRFFSGVMYSPPPVGESADELV